MAEEDATAVPLRHELKSRQRVDAHGVRIEPSDVADQDSPWRSRTHLLVRPRLRPKVIGAPPMIYARRDGPAKPFERKPMTLEGRTRWLAL
jgi:hypothetical protein